MLIQGVHEDIQLKIIICLSLSVHTDEIKVMYVCHSNIDIANGFNRLFSNIGPALARNIPNGNANFTNYLNQKVDESLFLNPVTDEEIIEIVKDAKTKYSKDHDSIDMPPSQVGNTL